MSILTKRAPILEGFAAFVFIDTAELIRGHVRLFLVQDRDTGDRFWKLPGGKRKADENWHTAAAREIREELGIRIRVSPRDLFSVDTVGTPNPHQFVTFTHRDPELRLERLVISPESGIGKITNFDGASLSIS